MYMYIFIPMQLSSQTELLSQLLSADRESLVQEASAARERVHSLQAELAHQVLYPLAYMYMYMYITSVHTCNKLSHTVHVLDLVNMYTYTCTCSHVYML